MNYRVAEVLSPKDVGGAGTEPIQIKTKDPISRLMISFKTTKSKDAMDSYPHKNITKIELLGDGDVLHSMNGGENQALCIYDRKVPTMNHGQAHASLSQFDTYGIDFGRFLFDPKLALDPKKFESLVLNVTYDEDVSDTGVTANELAVYAHLFDEKAVSPIGFLMAQEHWNADKPTSGYEWVSLPNDKVIRKLILQAYKEAYEPWYQVSEARLDEDNGKRIPFDWNLETYYRLMKGVWRPVEENLCGMMASSGTAFYITPTDFYATVLAIACAGAAAYVGSSYNFKGGKGTLYNNSGSVEFNGVARGYLPNHCFEFPLGNPDDIDDWYDPSNLESLRLRLKAGTGASTTTGVVLQRLQRY